MSSIVDGLQQVLHWPTLVYLLLGVIVGYVVGVLPGFGAPAALALILPSTISLPPTDGFVLLASVAAVSAMAGDITSILLGVPGEATSAAIVPDGHALAKRGRGAEAAGAALTAAWLGATVGAIVLALVLPFSKPLFGLMQSPELTALAVLGLCLVTALARGDPRKGLAAGSFGVALATIGLDPSLGQPRLTFGQSSLWDGAGLLPVALGIYAVPEALDMIRGRATGKDSGPSSSRGLLDGFLATVRRPGLLAKCGALGAGIGMLPGPGATITQWLAYAYASQIKTPSARFGEGAIEGVIAPATTTTATLGGALIPTLFLGIPGSVTAAFLLGALTFKGLTPGPSLLVPDELGGHLSLIWALIWCIVISSLLGAVLSAVSLGWVQKLAGISPSRLLPFILMLVIIGAIGERHVMADLGVVAILGLIGYTMSELAWPRAPLMLGFVLGPLLERRWLLSHAVYGWQWWLRPGVLLLIGLAAVFLYLMNRSTKGQGASSSASPKVYRGDLVVGGLLGLIAAAGFLWTWALAPRAAFFPRLAFGALFITALVCLWNISRRLRSAGRLWAGADSRTTAFGTHTARLAWLWAFIASAWLFGPVVGAALATALHALTESRARWREAVTITTAVGATAYVLVSQLMPFSNEAALLPWLTP